MNANDIKIVSLFTHEEEILVLFDAFIAFRIGLDNIIVTVQIEADKSYTASAVLDGAELSYFGQEGLSEVVVSQPSAAVTFQFQCSAESTNVSNNHLNV